MDEDMLNNQGQGEAQQPQDELIELKKKCEEYLNNWKRERADFINYKKEEMERIGIMAKYTREDIILKILPMLDSIELAKKQLPEEMKNNAWHEGFLQIQKQIDEFLKKEGIEEIETVGKQFDPNTMEAGAEIENGDKGNAEG